MSREACSASAPDTRATPVFFFFFLRCIFRYHYAFSPLIVSLFFADFSSPAGVISLPPLVFAGRFAIIFSAGFRYYYALRSAVQCAKSAQQMSARMQVRDKMQQHVCATRMEIMIMAIFCHYYHATLRHYTPCLLIAVAIFFAAGCLLDDAVYSHLPPPSPQAARLTIAA